MYSTIIDELLKEVNTRFETNQIELDTGIVIDVELSGRSPTCKCMRASPTTGTWPPDNT